MPAQCESLKVCAEGDASSEAGAPDGTTEAWPLLLFVFESADAEETFAEVAALSQLDQLDQAPFFSADADVLTEQGVLGESWRRPAPQPPGRRFLHDLGSAIRPVHRSPSARPEHSL